MKSVLAMLIALISWPVLSQPFSLDVGWDELRRLDGKNIVADLRVGETALIGATDVCEKDAELHVYGSAELQDYSEFGTYYELTRLPGDGVSLVVALPLADGAGSKPEVEQALRMAIASRQFIENPTLPDCDFFARFIGSPGADSSMASTFAVESTNGTKSLSELLEGLR